jgi:hypothetical protein
METRDESGHVWLSRPIVKAEPLLPQPLAYFLRYHRENFVGISGPRQINAAVAAEGFGELLRHGVGMSGILQPQIIIQQRQPLGR